MSMTPKELEAYRNAKRIELREKEKKELNHYIEELERKNEELQYQEKQYKIEQNDWEDLL